MHIPTNVVQNIHFEDVPLVEFMYLHASQELPQVIQVTVVVFMGCLSSTTVDNAQQIQLV